jgi:hypothetical protein
MKKQQSRNPEELYGVIEGTGIFCLNCGEQMPEDALICLQCGVDVSTAEGITRPLKMAKRRRKDVITFAILGACACVLVAFAVLPKILKGQSQKPTTEITGAPVVYTSSLPTPTPAPAPMTTMTTPVWKTESYEIDTKLLSLEPGQMWSHPMQVQNDWRNVRLVGKFTAQGGEKNEIEAIVTNEDGLINWRKNYSYQPKAWYRSGPVPEDTIDATLPAGQSYFIFDNRLSPPASKTIRFNLRVEYERLAQP